MAYSTSIDYDTIQKLKDHLTISTIDHEDKIMNETTLKKAHIYCVVNNISAQKYGPLLEKVYSY